MIAIDTNILVHAHRTDSQWHDVALATLTSVAEGRAAWAIPWPCLHEFLAVVTHPRVFTPATPQDVARAAVTAWLRSPSIVLLMETDGYWPVLDGLLARSRVVGPRIHDARIAALCLHNRVTELLTADRDFSSFPPLRVRNPLVGE